MIGTNGESHIALLEALSEEISFPVSEFRAEKRTGQLVLHFSQGEIASVEIGEEFTPGNQVGSFAASRCALFAVRKVRWFMSQKKSGNVTLCFEQGDIASVKTFIRLSPGKKNRLPSA